MSLLSELLSEIIGRDCQRGRQEIVSGRFLVSQHAMRRMQERSVEKLDIMEAGRTAAHMARQKDGSCILRGKDLVGEPLTVVYGWERLPVIITVYYEAIDE